MFTVVKCLATLISCYISAYARYTGKRKKEPYKETNNHFKLATILHAIILKDEKYYVFLFYTI